MGMQPIDPAIAAKLNPNKLNGQAVLEKFRSLGFSSLDAGLVADCINVHKACVWQNTDEVGEEAVRDACKFLSENKLGIGLEVTFAKYGKYIWETKLDHNL